MKYLTQFIIFGIGTAVFLLVWFILDKTLVNIFGDSLLITSVAFVVGLCAGWVTDFLLALALPAKYK